MKYRMTITLDVETPFADKQAAVDCVTAKLAEIVTTGCRGATISGASIDRVVEIDGTARAQALPVPVRVA